MKKYYYTLLLLLSIGFGTFAQTTISLGVLSGAGSTNVLLSTSTTSNRYSRTMSVYTAAEIIAAGGFAGSISSLAWDKGGTGEYTSNDAYIKIYLKHVSNSTWPTSPVPDWSTEITGATEVFTSTTYSLPTGVGWMTVPFTTPFVWNGVDNVVVMVEWDRSSAPTSAINWGRSTTTDANATRVGSSSLNALVFLVNSSRPLVQFTISSSAAVTGVAVNTQGGVPATITTNAGTLQLEAVVLPANANQTVTWSLLNGTGAASISPTGLVTAQSDGTVWAKATSSQDTTMMDSLQVTISNQIIPITSIAVSAQGNQPVITAQGGTLQMLATILPANANQMVTWSLVPTTGNATISASGLITAQADGLVWAKAVSVQDASKKDSLEITISNQTFGILENNLRAVSVFPNPAVGDVFTVSLPENFSLGKLHLSIFNINGQLLQKVKITSTKQEIDVANLPNGNYVLWFEDGNNRLSQSISVQ